MLDICLLQPGIWTWMKVSIYLVIYMIECLSWEKLYLFLQTLQGIPQHVYTCHNYSYISLNPALPQQKLPIDKVSSFHCRPSKMVICYPATFSVYKPRNYDDLLESKHGRRTVSQLHSGASLVIGLRTISIGSSSPTPGVCLSN